MKTDGIIDMVEWSPALKVNKIEVKIKSVIKLVILLLICYVILILKIIIFQFEK